MTLGTASAEGTLGPDASREAERAKRARSTRRRSRRGAHAEPASRGRYNDAQ